jgi:hypothetical protein
MAHAFSYQDIELLIKTNNAILITTSDEFDKLPKCNSKKGVKSVHEIILQEMETLKIYQKK